MENGFADTITDGLIGLAVAAAFVIIGYWFRPSQFKKPILVCGESPVCKNNTKRLDHHSDAIKELQRNEVGTSKDLEYLKEGVDQVKDDLGALRKDVQAIHRAIQNHHG